MPERRIRGSTLRRSGTLRAGGLMLGGLFYIAFVIGAIIAVT